MNKVRISKYKKVVLIVSLVIFISLMGIVMIKPEWITDFLDTVDLVKPIVRVIKGDDYEEKKSELLDEEKKNNLEDVEEDEVPADKKLTDLLVETEGDKVEFSVDMSKIKQFTAGELYMEYEGVNIQSVDCIDPYDCVVNKVDDGEIVLISISPIGSIGKTGPIVKFGSIEYRGSGTLIVKETSKYVVLEEEEAVYFKPQTIKLD